MACSCLVAWILAIALAMGRNSGSTWLNKADGCAAAMVDDATNKITAKADLFFSLRSMNMSYYSAAVTIQQSSGSAGKGQ